MQTVILIKEGEIALKGLNRRTFEETLIKNLRLQLRSMGKFIFERGQSTITIRSLDNNDLSEIAERIKAVFGIAAFSIAYAVPKTMEAITHAVPQIMRSYMQPKTTFKVKAKRSDKSFPFTSPQIERELGHLLLTHFPECAVDVHHPKIKIRIEIREKEAYIYPARVIGAGGIPVGTSGKGLLLLSGGIDSPIAGYRMAKRGMRIEAVHFASPPYTSKRALQKTENLAEKIARYTGPIPFFHVPFTEIQENIRQYCKEDYFTIIMRRIMIKIAQKIAENEKINALITGESLGQVASQTIQAILCTDHAANIPILRPLIGLDKLEIIQTAREIDTFETSILPYEDCCTVFTPKHPKTKPVIEEVIKEESSFNFGPFIQQALQKTTCKILYPQWD